MKKLTKKQYEAQLAAEYDLAKECEAIDEKRRQDEEWELLASRKGGYREMDIGLGVGLDGMFQDAYGIHKSRIPR